MRIVVYKNEEYIHNYLEKCEWNAAHFLWELLRDNTFYEVLGDNSKLIVLLDGENVVSFAVYSIRDCIKDESLFPWIGFVYTDEKYRNHRYSQKVINYIINLAKNDKHTNIYIATDHIGLYEKYGFNYKENRIDIYNEDSRIYYYDLLNK